MERLISLITYQWQRKVVALLSALVLWLFISQSITDTKTIPHVPIRIINLPEDKTVPGMQPNGIIGKRIPLTIQGTKNVIDSLEPGDLEVLLDASTIQQNDWVVQISKKDLVSLNPSLDLSRYISEVSHPEFVLKVSPLMTTKIPIEVPKPTGNAPAGYKYLDIWPQNLQQLVTGPEEEVKELMNTGLQLVIDMDALSKPELDKIKISRDHFHDDEVSYFIPSSWKKINLPFKGGILEEINDAEAQDLHIDFLRKEFLSLPQEIAIRIFYPLETAEKLNPTTAPLLIEGKVKSKDNVPYLSMPLYSANVSALFLEVIQNNLEIVILAQATKNNEPLPWSVQAVDPQTLEDKYVTALISHGSGSLETRHTRKREMHLRERFRSYLQKLTLYTAPEKKLQIDVRLTKEGISAIPTAI